MILKIAEQLRISLVKERDALSGGLSIDCSQVAKYDVVVHD